MSSLTTAINLKVHASYTKALDLSTVTDLLSKVYTLTLADGNEDDEADLLFHDVRAVANSASDNLDLSGVLTDAFGTALLFAKIKFLLIKNLDDTQTFSVGPTAAVGWIAPFGDITDRINIAPGAMAVLVFDPIGVTVTAATADGLTVTNGDAGNAANYEIVIIGSTAAA